MKEFSPIAYLTKDQVEQMHKAVLRVLSKTGIHLPHAEARKLIKAAGAKEDEDGRILLPEAMVEDAIAKAPSSVPWYNQTQNKEFPLEINRVYFGAGSDSLYITDRKTEQIQRARLQDVIDNVRVLERLPGFDFVMSMGLPKEVEAAKVYPAVFREMLIHSTKPIVATSICLADLEIPYEMAKLVAGSADTFRERPFFVTYIQPESPFKYEEDVVDRLWFCGEKGIPTMAVASPNLGGGGPVTMEGALVQGTAESLAALVILQLKFPKAGFIFGSNSWATDMRTSIVCYGSPECATSTAAYADMGRFYNLPSWGGAGCTDAQRVDAQAGEEAFQSIFLALQSGATVVHDVGFLAYGSLYDARFLVLNDEMIARARSMWRPLELTEENLALSVIDDVARASIRGKGPTIYLKHPHTAKHFRQSLYLAPSFIDRSTISVAKQSETLLERLGKRVDEILSSDPTPTISAAMVKKLRAFK
ncbi:MAG: trimethylamine methyltransferase family protein [Candidatus Bipolaricaulota bacterium]|nr:trimethylamine methyltransferase family protein [Candidatus Bipolaricaulota bacterium]